MSYCANYATVSLQEHLGPDGDSLDVPWATFGGDRSARYDFEVPTAEPRDAYLQIQAFDVSEFGHDILLNGESLAGFDIPPGEGWQSWIDTITGSPLVEGENGIRIERDTSTDDAFAVGTVVVNWREPLE